MPHPRPVPKWFGPTYEQRRQRTVDLTRAAIDALLKARKPVSLSAIAAISRQVDRTAQGVSASAILRNAEAHSLFASSRTWRPPVSRTRRPSVKRNPFTLPVKVDRRMPDARRRLARLSKPELIEQLLELQNAYAVVRDAWLQASAEKVHPKIAQKITNS